MNDIYGVDPRAPQGSRELIQLLQRFGPTEGRFIYDFPTDWVGAIKERLAACPDIERQRAMAWLNKRRKALVRPRQPLPRHPSWAESAIGLEPCKGLIGPRQCSAHEIAIDEILFSPSSGLADAREAHVPRTPRDLADAAEILFEVSGGRVVLVDRNLRLSSGPAARRGFEPVLVEFLRRAARAGVEHFEVYTSRYEQLGPKPVERDESTFEAHLKTLTEQSQCSRLQLEYGFIEDDVEVPGRRQHGRYLLGVGCGLQFDDGFDARDDGSLNHVHWLGESGLEPLLSRFRLPSY